MENSSQPYSGTQGDSPPVLPRDVHNGSFTFNSLARRGPEFEMESTASMEMNS